MTSTRELYQKAVPIIDQVLELPPEQQDEAIANACGADSELERYLRGLFGHRKDIQATAEGLDIFKILRVSLSDETDPEEFGPYRILRRLGAGGMSVVYLARQPNPQRLVALKVLRATVNPGVLQREAETLARLRHPGIAHVYEAGTALTPTGSKPFFVMEFVSGANGKPGKGKNESVGGAPAAAESALETEGKTQTLRDYIKSQSQLTIRRALELVAEVCDAVAYAHERGVLHRDLKPVNILVDHLEHPKIIDFGIAELVGGGTADSSPSVERMVAGTPPYMSPELLRGDAQPPDVRGDIYALGVIAYELLADTLPFDMLTGQKLHDIRALREATPVALSSRVRGLPRDAEAIVAKAMARNPAQRYDGAASLAKDIRNFIQKKPVSARRNTVVYRASCLARRRPVISAATILALILIGAAGFRAYRENAGAKDALKLLVTGITKADTISVDGSLPTLTGVLDSVAEEVDARTALHRDAAASIHLLLGTLYLRGDPRGETAAKAGSHYQRAVEILEGEYGRSDERVFSARNNVAVALNKGGHPAEAAAMLEVLIPLREKAGDRRGAIVSRGNYAAALLRLKRTDEAIQQFETVFERFIEAGDKHGALAARAWEARALMDAGYLADAETLQREALQRSLQQGPDYIDLSLAIMDGLTHCLIDQTKWSDAEVELRNMRDFAGRFVAPENGLHHAILSKLLRVQRERGDQPGYLATLKELDAWEARYGNGS